MPILRLHAIETKKVCTISKELIDELQQLLQCPRDYFSLEVVQSIYIKDGEIIEGSPVVEMAAFDRGQEIQDKAAQVITRHIQSLGYTDVDVIFITLDRSKYYENGQHF